MFYYRFCRNNMHSIIPMEIGWEILSNKKNQWMVRNCAMKPHIIEWDLRLARPCAAHVKWRANLTTRFARYFISATPIFLYICQEWSLLSARKTAKNTLEIANKTTILARQKAKCRKTMHRAYQPITPANNKLLKKRWDERRFDRHRQKVQSGKILKC